MTISNDPKGDQALYRIEKIKRAKIHLQQQYPTSKIEVNENEFFTTEYINFKVDGEKVASIPLSRIDDPNVSEILELETQSI